MSQPPPILEVYQPGETTVVGFGGRDVLDDVNLADCREELLTLIRQTGCRVLAFDMTGVQLIPSGLLGLLASVRGRGADVHIYNPSPDVREVLSVTKLETLMPVFEVPVHRPASS